MKNVLFTGGSGFIGQNVLPFLKEKYNVLAPRRSDLNLFDMKAVGDYLKANKIDVVIHTANPCPSKNSLDTNERMLKNSLEMFLSFYNNKDKVEKLIFLGSGATYGKQEDIVSVKEDSFADRIPADDYGLAKHLMSHLAGGNVYELRVFGCYGPGDADSKFITHAIRCCLDGDPITIRQDCKFDYMHVYDLAKIIEWAIDSDLKYNSYNACSGKKVALSFLAEEVKRQMNSDVPLVLKKDGWNREYTASNERLLGEYNGDFISIQEGIKMQIEWERKNYVLGTRPKE